MLFTAKLTKDADAKPEKWLVFLHGILGSGANWRTFAKQIVAARPQWGALLVDLRLHGESLDADPPHTIEAAALDVVVVALRELDGATQGISVLGHSFGGKVAIEVARQIADRDPSRRHAPLGEPKPLDHLFVVDSTPGARPDHRGSSSVRDIVDLLTKLPSEFADRNAFTAWVEERGVSRPTAMWLAMNVRPIPNTTRFVFRIDVPAVRTMMDDYFARDLWPVIENPPSEMKTRTHIITGGKSEVVDAADLERARMCPRTTVDVLPDAGHWVHVDAPDALREIVLGYLDQ